MADAEVYYLIYRSKGGNIMYLGLKNGKPQSVGGKIHAMSFGSKEQAESYKKEQNINDSYLVTKG